MPTLFWIIVLFVTGILSFTAGAYFMIIAMQPHMNALGNTKTMRKSASKVKGDLSMIIVTFIIAAALLLYALYRKRHTITARDGLVLGIAAILFFLVMSGAVNALHAPTLSLQLFGTR